MCMRPITQDLIEGAILGAAVGDALGYPVEFLSRQNIKREALNASLISDDTQLMMAIAKAVIAARTATGFGFHFAKELVAWLDSPENNRAPGMACLTGARRLKSGVPWQEAGGLQSKGAGSIMRAAPIGLALTSPSRVIEWSRFSCLPTHRHPVAILATQAWALAIFHALHGLPFETISKNTMVFLHRRDADLDLILNRFVLSKINFKPEIALGSYMGIGDGWVAEEALLMALYVAEKFGDRFDEAIEIAVTIDGDSDTVGCLVGAILGARHGKSAISDKWLTNLEHKDDLFTLAERLYQRRAADPFLFKTPPWRP